MEIAQKRYYGLMVASGASGVSVGLGVGIAVTLFFVKKRLETKYSELASKDIAEAKLFYSALNKKDEFETPQKAVETLMPQHESKVVVVKAAIEANEAVRRYQGKGPTSDEVLEAVKRAHPEDRNIFVDSQPIDESDFDYEVELKIRTADAPYVISKEEFFENEPQHEQLSCSYYAGDDVLADEKDEVVPDSDATVGDDNLLRFGHGSGDPHIVYIRNERIQIDFEVAGSSGKFTEEVLGFIEHSDRRPKIRRFRGDDE